MGGVVRQIQTYDGHSKKATVTIAWGGGANAADDYYEIWYSPTQNIQSHVDGPQQHSRIVCETPVFRGGQPFDLPVTVEAATGSKRGPWTYDSRASSCISDDNRGFEYGAHDFTWSLHYRGVGGTADKAEVKMMEVDVDVNTGDIYVVSTTEQVGTTNPKIVVEGMHVDQHATLSAESDDSANSASVLTVLTKLSKVGKPLWSRVFEDTAASGMVRGTSLSVDQGASPTRIYVSGFRVNWGSNSTVTFKGPAGGAEDCKCDSSGGSIMPSGDVCNKVLTQKVAPWTVQYDANGHCRWVQSIQPDIASTGGYGTVTARTGVDDNWVYRVRSYRSTHSDIINQDDGGGVYVALTLPVNNVAAQFGRKRSAYDGASKSIATNVAPIGDVAVATTSSTGKNFVVKYDFNGHVAWVHNLGNTHTPKALTTDGHAQSSTNGDVVYVSGDTTDTLTSGTVAGIFFRGIRTRRPGLVASGLVKCNPTVSAATGHHSDTSSSTVRLDGAATTDLKGGSAASDDQYNDMVLIVYGQKGGTGRTRKERKHIDDYDGSTYKATITGTWEYGLPSCTSGTAGFTDVPGLPQVADRWEIHDPNEAGTTLFTHTADGLATAPTAATAANGGAVPSTLALEVASMQYVMPTIGGRPLQGNTGVGSRESLHGRHQPANGQGALDIGSELSDSSYARGAFVYITGTIASGDADPSSEPAEFCKFQSGTNDLCKRTKYPLECTDSTNGPCSGKIVAMTQNVRAKCYQDHTSENTCGVDVFGLDAAGRGQQVGCPVDERPFAACGAHTGKSYCYNKFKGVPSCRLRPYADVATSTTVFETTTSFLVKFDDGVVEHRSHVTGGELASLRGSFGRQKTTGPGYVGMTKFGDAVGSSSTQTCDAKCGTLSSAANQNACKQACNAQGVVWAKVLGTAYCEGNTNKGELCKSQGRALAVTSSDVVAIVDFRVPRCGAGVCTGSSDTTYSGYYSGSADAGAEKNKYGPDSKITTPGVDEVGFSTNTFDDGHSDHSAFPSSSRFAMDGLVFRLED